MSDVNKENEDIMNEFYETHRYEGDRPDWREMPELGEEDPEDGVALDAADLEALEETYSPDQPRDERGRWTDKGGGAEGGGFPDVHQWVMPEFLKPRSAPSQEQEVKLAKAYSQISRLLSDPDIGAELWSTLSSFIPESLRERIIDLANNPGQPIIGGKGGRALASAQSVIQELAKMLQDPDTGPMVEKLLQEAIKSGDPKNFIKSLPPAK